LPDLAERTRAVAVTRSRDGNECNLDAVAAELTCGQLSLREREPTAAGADADQHDTRCAWPASDHTLFGAAHARRLSAPARGPGDRSGSASSAFVLQPEQVAHRVSIDHPVGCRGRLPHA